MFTMPSGCTQPLAIDRQQNLKPNSPSGRLSLKRIADPARGVTPPQRLEKLLPDVGMTPAAEALMHRLPLAIAFRQNAPMWPERKPTGSH